MFLQTIRYLINLKQKTAAIFSLFLLFILLFNIVSPVIALTSNDLKSIINGTPYYDPNACDTGTSGGSGGGSVVVLDPGHSGNDIDNIDPQSGLRDHDYPNEDEMAYVFEIAGLVKTKLEADGYTVQMTKNAVRDTVSHRNRAEIANTANAAIAVSIHSDGGRQFDSFAQVYAQKVGLYRSHGDTRVEFTNADVATKSQQYATNIQQSREQSEGRPVENTDVNFGPERGATVDPGNIALVQLFSNVPWVYNEVGSSGGLDQSQKQKYADGLIQGIEKSVTATNSGGSSGSSSCCASSSSTNPGTIDENKKNIWNYLIGKGLTPPQAAAVMGNIQPESGFEPRRVQYGQVNSRGEISEQGKPSSLDDNVPLNGVSGYGLAQWTSLNRQQALDDAAKKASKKAGDLVVQLDYLYYEATEGARGGAWDQLKQQTDVRNAAITWHNIYEGSGDSPERIEGRATFATDILSELGSGTGAGTVSGSGGGGCGGNGVVAGNIVQTALNLSWPDGTHGLTSKPEYAAVIAHVNPAQGDKGADCGAFVGAVMISSGADPDYPVQQTMGQYNYVIKHPEKYDVTQNWNSLDELLPGDILIANEGSNNPTNGHTYIWTGKQPNGTDKAEASWGHMMPYQTIGYDYDIIGGNKIGHYWRVRLK